MDDFSGAVDEYERMIKSRQYYYLVLTKCECPGNEGFWIDTRRNKVGAYDVIIKLYDGRADMRDKQIDEICQ